MKRKDKEGSEGTEESFGLRLAKFSIRHPVTTWMVFLSFVVFGAISTQRIPLVLVPDISFPFVSVQVPYPNATPGQVEEAIVKPVEEALSTIPHVQRLNSRSNADGAWVGLGFDWGMDLDMLRSDVREKIDQIRADLPTDADRIFVRNFGTTDEPIIGGQISSKRDLVSSYDFLDTKIKKPLERLPGVAEVQIYGAQRQEIDVYLRLDDLKRHRVDVGSLLRRLNGANTNVSLGKVDSGETRYSAISRGAIQSVEQIREFPVNDRGLRLIDIADVVFDDPVRNFGRHLNGSRSIGFEVRKTSDANTVETVKLIRAEIDKMRSDPALEGITVLTWFDAGHEIVRSLTGLVESGTVGALLAVAVLYLFLRRLGATLAIGFAIPFSIIATIGVLYLLGRTLNVLSMMGLMLACGMLVDNAVVVLESIYQHLEKGKDRVTASEIGTKEVVTAVIAATLTSIIIFVPLVFGKRTNYSIFLSDTGTSIMIALAFSLFISLTLIPLGVAKLLTIDATKQSRFDRILSHLPLAQWSVTGGYLRLMGWTLRHRFLVGFLIVPGIVGGAIYALGKVPDNSPEAQDLQDLSIQYEFSENYHYAKIERDYVRPVEKLLLANRERFKIKDISSSYENNYADTRIYFQKDRITLEELKDIRAKIAKALPVIPGAEIRLGRQEGAESQNWIGVNIYGDESSTLQRLVREARTRLRTKPGFVEIHNDLDRGKEEVQIRLDRARARRLGVSPESVAGVLNIVLRGQQMRGYRTPEGEVEIWMRLRPEDRRNLEDLRSITVGGSPDGRSVQLYQVAQLDVTKTPGVIQREDRRSFTWMFCNYSGDKKEEGKAVVTDVMNSLDYPQGFGWSYGFWEKRSEQEDKDFFFNILLALFMVYFVMASLFESLVHPFAIMLSLPFALVGVVGMLLATGTPFNLMSKIGLMVLIGVVVNNGIVLLDHVNNLRRSGLSRADAIVAGCRERFRPILMTASTTIVGLVPLALGTSGLFELRYFPLARTVMGGLLSSTVLTLVVLPTYYTLFDDLAVWARRTWRASDPARPEQAEVFGD